ncbi:MAG: DUF5060 domain-containing protein [Thermoproteota archaeon]|nr:DUF5060 domain-containing protein [Thermoproteota archaeon]
MTKRYSLFLFLFFHCLFIFAAPDADEIERWSRFEASFKGPQSGNPFTDVWLTAEFSNGHQKFNVEGFYDGEGVFKIRFMPNEIGEWKYTTKSNRKELNGKIGSFRCVLQQTITDR